MLLVDERAGSAELIPLLGDLVCPFYGEGSTADVIVPGNGPIEEILIGVEVKKISDLLSSESTGRLAATQLPQLFVDYQHVWLLTVGDYRAGVNGRLEVSRHRGWTPYRIGPRPVPYAYLEAFLVEIQVMGVHLKQCQDLREAAQWLICLHNWWAKPWDKHRAMHKLDRSGERAMMPDMDANTTQMVKIAAQLPGVGWERAWAAAQCFANPESMMVATQRQWEEVPGIGRVIAKAIVEATHGRY